MKKIISVMLTVSVILSACSTALGALPNTATYNDTIDKFNTNYANQTGGRWIDDFDNADNLNTATKTYTSSIYTVKNTEDATQATMSMVDGKNGKALKLTSNPTKHGAGIRMGYANMLTSDELKANYGQIFFTDFRFEGTPEGAAELVSIMTDGYSDKPIFIAVKNIDESKPYKITDSGKTVEFIPGDWYRMVYYKTASNKKIGYILDSSNTVLISKETNWIYGDCEAVAVAPVRLLTGSKGMSVTLDNSTYIQYKKDKWAPTVEAIEGTEATNVKASLKKIQLVSDQLITTSAVNLTYADSSAIECTVAFAEKFTDDGRFIYDVTWTDDLATGTAYTLDFSAFVNDNSASASGTFTFSTAQLDVTAPTKATTAGGDDVVSVEFTLTDWAGYDINSSMLMAAIYQGDKMAGLGYVNKDNYKDGSGGPLPFNTGTVIFENLEWPKAGDYKISLFAMNNANGFCPVAAGEKAFTVTQ